MTRSACIHALQEAWRSRGPLAVALLPLSALFGLLSAIRRLAYRVGLAKTRRLSVPVVVVGNLIVGGAGKTPTVIAVVELLRRHGYAPGVIARGYGRRESRRPGALVVGEQTTAAECGDEPKLLALRTRAPTAVARDRVAAGEALLRAHPEVNIIVSDDGLQHFALARDAQVIVFDERGVGNGWLLPAGPLRERAVSRPARSAVLYNALAPNTPWAGSLAQRGLTGVAPLAQWWQGAGVSLDALAALRGRRLTAAAGIANPTRFFELLRAQGLQFTELPLPDHHDYAALPWPAGTPDVVVTEKDAVKLDPQRMSATRVWVAALDFRTSPQFDRELIALLPPR